MIDLIIFILKYTFLAFIYLFLFWLLRLIAKDLRQEKVGTRPRQRAKIILEKSPGLKKPRTISFVNEATIGRGNKNTVVLNDVSVSTTHARIYAQDDHFVIEDLGSTNGTFVSDQIIVAPVPLRSGTLIKIGRSRLYFTEK